jgi:hypothetical protein
MMDGESTPPADREGSATDRREFMGAVWGGMIAAGAIRSIEGSASAE